VIRALKEVGSITDEYFEDTGVGLSLQQVFRDKITLLVGTTLSQNDYNAYEDRPRKDDNYKVHIGLDYDIRDWLRAGLSYSYWRKDSDMTRYDFTNHRYMATIDVVY
jgi:hypothetical protein